MFTYTGRPIAPTEDEDEQHGTAQRGQHSGHQAQQRNTGQMPPPPQQQQLADVQLRLGGTTLQLCCRQLGQSTAGAAAAASSARAAAEALAALVLACPAYFNNTDVLELCSWDAPLSSLAALRWCRRAVAAGASEAAVALLRRNAQRNSHLFLIERLRLQQLAWQQPPLGQEGRQERQQQEQQLRRAFPRGFQAVLAAVPAAEAELPSMLAAASAQLSHRPGALLLLCAGSAAAAQQAAAAVAAVGLREAAPMAAELAAAATTVSAISGMHFVALCHCK